MVVLCPSADVGVVIMLEFVCYIFCRSGGDVKENQVMIKLMLLHVVLVHSNNSVLCPWW